MNKGRFQYTPSSTTQQKLSFKPVSQNKTTFPLVVISGGQTGADKAGLIAAKNVGVRTGGTAPKGYRTEDGSDYELRDLYYLKEGPPGYPTRTMMNVDNSDGTIAIRLHPGSGTDKTIGYAHIGKWVFGSERGKTKLNGYKPILVIGHNITDQKEVEEAVSLMVSFIIDNNIRTVNIAGHRETTAGMDNFQETLIPIFEAVFQKVVSIRQTD
eukprot:TRINITY_DN7872_c0_g1_i3.p1 TRINITY_DN7872_c0_g1~~TRINITY_DN7872_c0_g1_i3.p1  ORF type:complete len:212 (-),score=37.01 TRINITY_DN7872_c0_g1_i3:108-743(-)